jgi:hypothetical protein
MRSFLSRIAVGGGVAVALAACGGDAVGPPVQGHCAGSPITVAALQGTVIQAGDLPCLSIPADGGTYVVVPQFPTASAPLAPVNFTLTAGTAATAATARIVTASRRTFPLARGAAPGAGELQRAFEGRLRRRERDIATTARATGAPGGPLASRVHAEAVPPAVGSSRSFQVLSNFESTTQYKTDTAVLKYSGAHLLIYQSINAPPPPNGFTDAEIAAFGNTFDLDLYTIDVATFGAPTDIDANGRVIVLLSPIINALTPTSQCQDQGYIAGFFNAIDLLPGQYSHSNGAEIFYSLVPDPAQVFSCTHTISSVGTITPATFIHEFQHMISFGQHAILRNGDQEDSWLNEGLSHIAEELGSRYYERRFPPPTGRTDPGQGFPDSAQGFISGDLYNSYHYLLDPSSTDTADKASVSNWGNGDGKLVQRGAAWLFLRWLGDQQDSTVYGRLDQTSLTGVPNVVSATGGTPFATLFGEFALALYVDSLPGIPRSSIPSPFRFTSRNLRAFYGLQNARNPQNFPVAFPIELKALTPGTAVHGSMYPGTMDFYVLHAPTSGSATALSFAPTSGSTFSGVLNAQVSVFHCPSAAACP